METEKKEDIFDSITDSDSSLLESELELDESLSLSLPSSIVSSSNCVSSSFLFCSASAALYSFS